MDNLTMEFLMKRLFLSFDLHSPHQRTFFMSFGKGTSVLYLVKHWAQIQLSGDRISLSRKKNCKTFFTFYVPEKNFARARNT